MAGPSLGRRKERSRCDVSCHLPALVRDAERLATLGWSARHAVAVDQFPWTPHAEWVVRFAR